MDAAQIIDIQREIHKDETESLYLQTFIFVLMNFYFRPYHFLNAQYRFILSRYTTVVY